MIVMSIVYYVSNMEVWGDINEVKINRVKSLGDFLRLSFREAAFLAYQEYQQTKDYGKLDWRLRNWHRVNFQKLPPDMNPPPKREAPLTEQDVLDIFS